jgi:hypothetical protein
LLRAGREEANAQLLDCLEKLGLLDGLPNGFHAIIRRELFKGLIFRFVQDAVERDPKSRDVLMLQQLIAIRTTTEAEAQALSDQMRESLAQLDGYEEWMQQIQAQMQELNHMLYAALYQGPVGLSSRIPLRAFETLIEERTKLFTGRSYLFEAIDRLVADPEFPSGYFLIVGEPGYGKTALIAELVKQRAHIHHFNIAKQGIRSPQDFLASVCAQLIIRYDLDRYALFDADVNNSALFSNLLSEAVGKEPDKPLVILIDALDESGTVQLQPKDNRLFLPATLPAGVFIVITSRPLEDYRLEVDRCHTIYTNAGAPLNLGDISAHIARFIAKHPARMTASITAWGVEQDEFIDILTARSEGNFMYLHHVLPDIRDSRLSVDTIEDVRRLPSGLKAYYQTHWRTMRAHDVDRYERYYEPVVCRLAAAYEPVSVDLLAEWTDLPPMRVRDVLNDWRQFLDEDLGPDEEPLYSIYHLSFQEFLDTEVGLGKHHAAIAKKALDKIPGFYDQTDG